MTNKVRCPVPGCGKPIKHQKNIPRHIKYWAHIKRDPAHSEYLRAGKHRGPLPPRETPSEPYKGARGPAPTPSPETHTPPGGPPTEIMAQLPAPPKPVTRGGAPPSPVTRGEAPLAEKAELSGLTFAKAPPARYEALPGAIPYSTVGAQMGTWDDDSPAPGYETAIEFFYKLTAAFAAGEIEDLGKPKKDDYVAFAKYLRNRKGVDLDPMVVGLITGSKIIIGMLVNIILGFMKLIEKWKERAAKKKAEVEAEALESEKTAQAGAGKEKPAGA